MASVRKIVLSILLLICIHASAAQDISYTLYNESNGLNVAYINDIKKDSTGYYWLATERGIIRFDGRNFLEINPKQNEFKSQEVRKIYQYKNTLYIIYKDSGCFSLDLLSYQFKMIQHGATSDVVHLNADELVLLMRDGTMIKRKKDLELKVRKGSAPQKPGSLVFHNQKLIVSLPNIGIYVVDPKTLELTYKVALQSDGFNEYFYQNQGKLNFLSRGKVFELDSLLIQSRPTPYVSEKFRETISSFFLVSAAQQFYIENNKTLVEVNNRSRQQISLMGLDNFELRVLFIEDRNNILVGTNQGLVCVKKNERPLYAIDDNQPSSVNQIRIRRKIVEDEKKQLILLGHPYSYLYGSDARFQNILNAPFSMYDAVLVDDFIYVTTDGRGLRKINIKNHLNDSITGWPFTPDGSYCSIYYDSITADLYVGDIGKLIIYNIRSNQRTFIPLPRNNAIIRAIRKDTSNHIFWIGTDKGLLMVNKEKKWVVPFRSNKSTISERKINDLLIRRNTSELWVAHDGGVDVIDLKTKTVLKRLPGYMFINPKTVSLVESNHGSIWMGTYVGIIGYEPKSDRFIRLGQNNGLVNKEFNHKSATKLSSGDLIFGGLSGYDVLNPDKYVFMNEKTRGIVTGYHRFTSADTTFTIVNNTTNRISFDTEKELLRVYLSSNDFINANNHTYEYTINGREWIKISGPSYINILRLDPGEYELNVRAFDQYGVLLEFNPLIIDANISFFKSRLFLWILIVAAFASLLLLLITILTLRRREKILKERISMDLHDEVGTTLTRALHLVQHENNKAETTQMNNYLSEALYSLRVYINTMNKKSFSLQQFEDEVTEMAHNFTRSEECQIIVATDWQEDFVLEGELFRDIKLCLFEIINNVLKHSRATQLRISLQACERRLIIHTQDNGLLQEITSIENRGNGIKNIRKRVTRHHGKVNFSIADGGHGMSLHIEYPK